MLINNHGYQGYKNCSKSTTTSMFSKCKYLHSFSIDNLANGNENDKQTKN